MLSEKSHRADVAGIHLVHQWVSILGQRCSEYNHLIELRHGLQKIVYPRSLLDEDVAYISININWNHIIGILNLLELTMY